MFEVILSHVLTGKVERRSFSTRADAESYIAKREDQVLSGRKSLRDFRMEIQYRQPATIHSFAVPRPTYEAA